MHDYITTEASGFTTCSRQRVTLLTLSANDVHTQVRFCEQITKSRWSEPYQTPTHDWWMLQLQNGCAHPSNRVSCIGNYLTAFSYRNSPQIPVTVLQIWPIPQGKSQQSCTVSKHESTETRIPPKKQLAMPKINRLLYTLERTLRKLLCTARGFVELHSAYHRGRWIGCRAGWSCTWPRYTCPPRVL